MPSCSAQAGARHRERAKLFFFLSSPLISAIAMLFFLSIFSRVSIEHHHRCLCSFPFSSAPTVSPSTLSLTVDFLCQHHRHLPSLRLPLTSAPISLFLCRRRRRRSLLFPFSCFRGHPPCFLFLSSPSQQSLFFPPPPTTTSTIVATFLPSSSLSGSTVCIPTPPPLRPSLPPLFQPSIAVALRHRHPPLRLVAERHYRPPLPPPPSPNTATSRRCQRRRRRPCSLFTLPNFAAVVFSPTFSSSAPTRSRSRCLHPSSQAPTSSFAIVTTSLPSLFLLRHRSHPSPASSYPSPRAIAASTIPPSATIAGIVPPC